MHTENTELIVKKNNKICELKLNRPEKSNALSEEILVDLINNLKDIKNDSEIRVVIISSSGDVFSAGHDLKQMMKNPSKAYYNHLFNLCSTMMMTLKEIPQPIIAKIDGIATAAGCQLVASCDLAISSSESTFAVSGVNVGLFCSTPSVALSRNINRKKAAELLFTGDFISARQARDLGLINNFVPLEKLDSEVNNLANKIISKSKTAISIGKKLFYKQIEVSTKEAYKLAAETMACNMMEKDAINGINNFIKKN